MGSSAEPEEVATYQEDAIQGSHCPVTNVLRTPECMQESRAIHELRSAMIADPGVRLLIDSDGRYSVKIEVWAGAWEDISLRSDQGLALHTASLCYRLRLTEQEARAVEWEREA